MNARNRAWTLAVVGAVVLALPARGLDTDDLQVTLEVRLVEVSHTAAAELGLGLFGRNQRLDAAAQTAVGGALGAALTANADSRALIESMTAIASSESGRAALSSIDRSGHQLGIALEALEKNGKVRSISRPTVTAQDHQLASIVALQERPEMLGDRGRRLARNADAYREAYRCAADDLALLGVAADLGLYLVPFLSGGRGSLEAQGVEVNGDLRLSSAKQRGSKKRYLRMRGRGKEPVSGFVVTPQFSAGPGESVIAMADLGIFKKPSPSRLRNFEPSFVALELDIGVEFFVIGYQAGADGQVQVFVADAGGVQKVMPLPPVEVNPVITAYVVADGSTVSLGGILRNSVDADRTAVPFLSNIPYIGGQFRAGVGGTNLSRKTDAGASNLLIMVTPQTVQDPSIDD